MEIRHGSPETDEAVFRWLLEAAEAHASEWGQHGLRMLVARLASGEVPQRLAARMLCDALTLSLGEVELRRRMERDRREGGGARGKQKTAEAAAIRTWLYPLFAESDAWLRDEHQPRCAEFLVKETRLHLMPEDPHRDLVTLRRAKDWIRKGRPPT